MNEKESWGVLTSEQFNDFLKRFTEKFGSPDHQKRLSLSFWNTRDKNVDTRIRITNGQAIVMQKTGSWEGTKIWDRK